MKFLSNAAPYPHIIIDDFFKVDFLWMLQREKMPEKLFRYADENAHKETSVPEGITGIFKTALEKMAIVGKGSFPECEPDLTFYGAGFSVMRAGDFLRAHVDHAKHPVTGFTRVWNLIVYLTECDGGDLELWGDDAYMSIKPKPNRGVLFRSFGEAVHAVAPVLSGERKALSVYFYQKGLKAERTNKKAKFL